jgi:hypothetical protein
MHLFAQPAFGPNSEAVPDDEHPHHQPAVLDHVDLEEARWWVAPIRERANRDAATNGRPNARSSLALPVDARTRITQRPVDRRGTDLQELGLDHGI